MRARRGRALKNQLEHIVSAGPCLTMTRTIILLFLCVVEKNLQAAQQLKENARKN
jgi:uncharacterized membrane protein